MKPGSFRNMNVWDRKEGWFFRKFEYVIKKLIYSKHQQTIFRSPTCMFLKLPSSGGLRTEISVDLELDRWFFGDQLILS